MFVRQKMLNQQATAINQPAEMGPTPPTHGPVIGRPAEPLTPPLHNNRRRFRMTLLLVH
jgi:hypothetical protein